MREAIENAENDAATHADCAAGDGDDTIVFAAGVTLVTLTSDLPTITDPDGLTVDGSGAVTIDGADAGRQFTVDPGAVLTVLALTLTGGLEGAVFNDGGTVTIEDSVIDDNSAAGSGGGIDHESGTLTITDSTISNNTADDDGAGIEIASGTVTVSGSTISGNSAVDDGGGIDHDDGDLTITNSTISGNSAGGEAGGIESEDGTLVLRHSTVTDNSSVEPGGGLLVEDDGTVTLINTIIADQAVGADCVNEDPPTSSLTSAGNNLDSDGTCPLIPPGDLPNTDPLLGPLADNGGPTQTHALLPGSPAIDAASADCPPTDQRGVFRPQGAACDIGAYELEGVAAPPSVLEIPTVSETGLILLSLLLGGAGLLALRRL